jgi:hypothetical protein
VRTNLFNNDLRAWHGFAAEALNAYFAKANHAVFGGMNSEVAAYKCAITGKFGLADLPNDNFTSVDFLATKTLHTQALAGGVMNVFTGTACFYV